MLAAYGSGAGALLALAGPRAGATLRSLIAVNGAALASLGSGAWHAMALARRPLPCLQTPPTGMRSPPTGPAHEEPGVVCASLHELANPLTPALAAGAGLSAVGGRSSMPRSSAR